MRSWQAVLLVAGIIVAGLMAFVWPAMAPVIELGRWSRTYRTEAEAKTALAQNPDDVMAHYTMSVHARNPADRLRELKIVCQLDPNNQWAVYETGLLLYQRGRNSETIPLLKSITHPRLVLGANVMLQKISKVSTSGKVRRPVPAPR